MRKQIGMTNEEAYDFLRQHHMGVLSTVGKDGTPHMVTVSYLVEGDTVRFTSYAKAQKAVNARRDPRAALLVEIPRPYHDVKGVLLRGDLEISEDAADAERVMFGIAENYARLDPENWAVNPKVDIPANAPKRVVLALQVRSMVTWDHSRLGAGVY